MVLTRCVSMNEVRNAIDLQLLLTIVAALGLGRALTASGAARVLRRTWWNVLADTLCCC